MNPFPMFARYNQWANRRLYAAAADIGTDDYMADRGLFFGSLHGTLNHLLVTDRIWMHRLTGDGPTYDRLDIRPCDDLGSLATERAAEDDRIIAFVDGLTDDDLAGTFSYSSITNPKPFTQQRANALSHLFNHQTHHRGQAHTALTIAGGRDAAPPLDLLFFQREAGIG